MSDHPDETARAARPLDKRCAGIFDAPLGDRRAIATARLAVRPHRGPGMPDGTPCIV